MTEEYQYQLETELEYLQAELHVLDDIPFPDSKMNSLEAVKRARQMVRSYCEQQVLINANKILADGLDRAFESLKSHLKRHSGPAQISIPENASLSELMDLAIKTIDGYAVRHEQILQVIDAVESNLQVLAESESHCTRNNWQASKDGIIQALSLRLCANSRDRLRRCQEDSTIGFRSDKF